MAKRGRPAKIKYRDGGEIIIKGLNELDTNLVKNIIRESEVMVHPWEEPLDTDKLDREAFTVCKKDNKYFIVTFKFSLETKQAIVVNTEEIASLGVAETEFKKKTALKTLADLRKV